MRIEVNEIMLLESVLLLHLGKYFFCQIFTTKETAGWCLKPGPQGSVQQSVEGAGKNGWGHQGGWVPSAAGKLGKENKSLNKERLRYFYISGREASTSLT